MAVEGGMKCIKILLCSFNFIFLIAGLALIVVGALGLTKFKDIADSVFSSQVHTVATFVIVVGVIVFIVSALGFCGALRESYLMLMVFAVCLIIILILEIVVAILAFHERGEVKKEVEKFMKDTKDDYESGKGVKAAWDFIQSELECCGYHNYSSWDGINVGTGLKVPKSCCKDSESSCTGAQQDVPGKIYTKGCFDATVTFSEDNLIMIGAVALACAFIEILGIVFACCLAFAVKRAEYDANI